MIDKHTFVDLLTTIKNYTAGLEDFEKSLQTLFDDNFLTQIIDCTLVTLGEGFFTQEQLDCLENQAEVETVIDMIYHFAFKGEFGAKPAELQRLYVEDENKSNERAFNAFTPEELYVIIDRYLHPKEVAETYTIHC
jgi:hypothetical protein